MLDWSVKDFHSWILVCFKCKRKSLNICKILGICGIENKPVGRIIGGEVAFANQFPWLLDLTFGENDNFQCTAILISDEWLITAAHCVNGVDRSVKT